MAAPRRRPDVTAAAMAGKKSVSPLAPNPCLVAVILTVSSSAGSRSVFHYPPDPTSFPRTPVAAQHDLVDDDSYDELGLTDDEGGNVASEEHYGYHQRHHDDDSDAESRDHTAGGDRKTGQPPGGRAPEDEQDGHYDRLGLVVGMADVVSSAGPPTDQAASTKNRSTRTTWQAEVIRKATHKLTGRRKRRKRKEERSVFSDFTDIEREEMDIRAYLPKEAVDRFGRHNEMSRNPGDTNLADWEKLLGYPTAELAKLLSPSRVYDRKRFELGIDDLVFLGAPRFARKDGRWSRRRMKGKVGIYHQHQHPHPQPVVARSDGSGDWQIDGRGSDGIPVETEGELDNNLSKERGDDGFDPDDDHHSQGSGIRYDSDHGSQHNINHHIDIENRSVTSNFSCDSSSTEMTMFNIVFVLNPPTLEHWIRVEEMYEHVVRKFSKVLKYEQSADSLVWQQAKQIWDIQEKAKEDGMSTGALWQLLVDNSPLARAIATVYEAISTARIAHVNISGRLDAYFQIPQPVSTSYMPTIMRPQIPGLWLTTASMAHYGLGDPNDADDIVLLDEAGEEIRHRDVLRVDSTPELTSGNEGTLSNEAIPPQLHSSQSRTSISPSRSIPKVKSARVEEEEPTRPPSTLSPHAALLLLDESAALLRHIRSTDPSALTDALTAFILLISPTMSLLQLATTANASRLARAVELLLESDEFDEKTRPAFFSASTIAAASEISLREMQLLGQHLIYWRRARAIPPLHPRDTYVVSANANMRAIERDSIRFALRFCASVKSSCALSSGAPEMIVPSLPELLERLSEAERPGPYREIIGRDADRETKKIYMDVLAWLMRYGYVTQLRTFAWVLVPPEVKRMVRESGEEFDFWNLEEYRRGSFEGAGGLAGWRKGSGGGGGYLYPGGHPNSARQHSGSFPSAERERPRTGRSSSSILDSSDGAGVGPNSESETTVVTSRFQDLYSAVQRRIPWPGAGAGTEDDVSKVSAGADAIVSDETTEAGVSNSNARPLARPAGHNACENQADDTEFPAYPPPPGAVDPTIIVTHSNSSSGNHNVNNGYGASSASGFGGPEHVNNGRNPFGGPFENLMVDESQEGEDEPTVVVSPLDASARELAWLSKIGDLIGGGGLVDPEDEISAYTGPVEGRARKKSDVGGGRGGWAKAGHDGVGVTNGEVGGSDSQGGSKTVNGNEGFSTAGTTSPGSSQPSLPAPGPPRSDQRTSGSTTTPAQTAGATTARPSQPAGPQTSQRGNKSFSGGTGIFSHFLRRRKSSSGAERAPPPVSPLLTGAGAAPATATTTSAPAPVPVPAPGSGARTARPLRPTGGAGPLGRMAHYRKPFYRSSSLPPSSIQGALGEEDEEDEDEDDERGCGGGGVLGARGDRGQERDEGRGRSSIGGVGSGSGCDDTDAAECRSGNSRHSSRPPGSRDPLASSGSRPGPKPRPKSKLDLSSIPNLSPARKTDEPGYSHKLGLGPGPGQGTRRTAEQALNLILHHSPAPSPGLSPGSGFAGPGPGPGPGRGAPATAGAPAVAQRDRGCGTGPRCRTGDPDSNPKTAPAPTSTSGPGSGPGRGERGSDPDSQDRPPGEAGPDHDDHDDHDDGHDDGHFHSLLAAATREFWPRLLAYLDGSHALEDVAVREGMNGDLVADMVRLLDREGWLVVYRGW